MAKLDNSAEMYPHHRQHVSPKRTRPATNIHSLQRPDSSEVPAVTGLPLSRLVRVQPGKLFNKNDKNMGGEGFESLTPIPKKTEILRRGEVVISKTELSAGNMAPLFTSWRLETVMLEVIIWTSSSSCVNLGRQDSLS
jgi:hypothetical protein